MPTTSENGRKAGIPFVIKVNLSQIPRRHPPVESGLTDGEKRLDLMSIIKITKANFSLYQNRVFDTTATCSSLMGEAQKGLK
ncbi:hypothetical protein SG0102_17820 [Intestinibaculum porci]|uniref:Uncharacterized protein n=1 Tax=Intestinibaculum porci TaxID=2487118 RepID=A0A3G9JRD0_9FIRM|nr:hypothetical protein SG0102_17820 [Intestinibaculum porci]